MSLVAYPDSDADEQVENAAELAPKAGSKRKNSLEHSLPPLPAGFHDLYTANVRVSTSDNPSLHGGRKRAVPHIQGNWPSHIYLEWVPSQAESDQLHNLIQHVRDCLALQNTARASKTPIPDIIPSLRSDLGAPLPLHISLSRTLQVKTQDKESFHKTVETCVRRTTVRTFQYAFRGLKWVSNFDRTRWFLVLDIKKPARDEFNQLLDACNKAVQSCGHHGLYTGGLGDGPMEGIKIFGPLKSEPSVQDDRSAYFHVSIAWNLSEPDPEWISLVKNIDITKYIHSPEAAVDAVKVKIGNVVKSIALETRMPGIDKGSSIIGIS